MLTDWGKQDESNCFNSQTFQTIPWESLCGRKLKVGEGDIYGFLGPNGAGKSTTLKMILGLARPTNGIVTVFGKDFETNRHFILKQIGSLIESPSYYGHLTGLENMRIIQST